ncbi:nucleotide exchange factor GrpE [Alienimonas chondri]|uniref:Protein GrpE n=1 Tax=Alienimonas chondri TaxID=2681879 RepID=A0ABX1VC49_9PLAN|nr:nucleotide exchange factor GrpE [Alienimonas chondri]NNJ25690.1 Protein GrpE [Alienimonas chondri]
MSTPTDAPDPAENAGASQEYYPADSTPEDAPQPNEPGPMEELAEPPGDGAGEPEPELSREQYEAAAAERDELREKLLRAQAETENVRKRSVRDQSEGRKYAAVPLAKALLPGLDDLRRAVDAAKASREAGADAERLADDLVGGVAAVLKSLEKALNDQGISPIPAVGEMFDPNRHEALAQAPSLDHPPGTVIQEAQRGYAAGDRVVRPSHVIVATAPSD